jgi:hypothetical protein
VSTAFSLYSHSFTLCDILFVCWRSGIHGAAEEDETARNPLLFPSNYGTMQPASTRSTGGVASSVSPGRTVRIAVSPGAETSRVPEVQLSPLRTGSQSHTPNKAANAAVGSATATGRSPGRQTDSSRSPAAAQVYAAVSTVTDLLDWEDFDNTSNPGDQQQPHSGP